MLLEVEFVVRKSVSVAEGSFFRSMLIHNRNMLTISQGEDIYGRDVTINPQETLAALGRRRRVDAHAKAQEQTGTSAKPINLKYKESDGISLLIISDLFLDQDELTETLECRLSSSNGNTITVPLRRVEWIGRGMFVIDIGALIRELFEDSDRRPIPTAINT